MNNLGGGRVLSREQAFDLLEETEKAGLVHLSNNFQSGQWFICNCPRYHRNCTLNPPFLRAAKSEMLFIHSRMVHTLPGHCAGDRPNLRRSGH